MSANTDTIIAALSQANGSLQDETGIYYEGTRRVIPELYQDNPMDYVMELHAAVTALGEKTKVSRTFTYRPWDVAVVLERMFKDRFGMSLASIARGFDAGNTVEVTLDHKGTVMSVPWGRFAVDFLKGTLSLGADRHPTYGIVSVVTIALPLMLKERAENFLNLIADEMKVQSIYRGHAISGGENPEFMDYTKLDPDSVIYTDQVFAELDAHIWSRIKYRDALAADGIDFKRAVLIYGPWGTGKTLVGDLTSRISVENGVTYVYGRPQQDDIEDLMQVARLYAPAVVFVEDADTLPSGTTAETSKLLDLFDGLEAKHNDVMVVMTTNHIERIPAGMLRPGRLDHIIEINHMDDAARERFVRRFLDESQIDPELDMAPINEAMSGFVAAYVKAAVQNAVWYARSQNDGKKPNVITTQNLVHAAMGLRPQFELHVNAQEQHMTPDLAEILRDALTPAMLDAADRAAGVVQDTVRDAAVSPDTLREIVGGTVDNIVHGARIVDGDGEEVFNVQTSY